MSSRDNDYQDDSNYGSSNTGRGSSGIAASDEPARVRGEYEQNPNTTTGGGRGGGVMSSRITRSMLHWLTSV